MSSMIITWATHIAIRVRCWTPRPVLALPSDRCIMGEMRRTPTIAGAVLVSVLTVGGVAWANGSSDGGSSSQQQKDCPQRHGHAGWAHHGTGGKIVAVTASSIT